jgi:hypothetical protein
VATTGQYDFSGARYPLVILNVHGSGIEDAEFASYLSELGEQLARAERANEHLALIIDTLGATRAAPASQRRMQADWVKTNFERSRDHCAGVAFVINSPLVRGILTAILWMQRMPNPHCVFATRESAEAWCHARLDQCRLSMTG